MAQPVQPRPPCLRMLLACVPGGSTVPVGRALEAVTGLLCSRTSARRVPICSPVRGFRRSLLWWLWWLLRVCRPGSVRRGGDALGPLRVALAGVEGMCRSHAQRSGCSVTIWVEPWVLAFAPR
ncbi:hypothetical protein BD414DRAFT_498781 [Trametes punicea]|nr:hypothetical protein BD414DRAFT_498781 [Trametes punicea]